MHVAFYLSHVIIANIISTIFIVYTMKTVKHKLKPFNPEQEIQFLALARAYQFEKNYWSDQLLKRRERSGNLVNLKNLYTYQQIRNSHKLTKDNYQSRYNLPIRYCTIALKEAYDLHIRTYESQIAFLKRDLNNRIYKFKLAVGNIDKGKLRGESVATPESSLASPAAELAKATAMLNLFKDFLYFATNSLFYNYKTFRTFEEEFYSKKFRKARIYQRIQPILKKLFDKASVAGEADVFKLNQVEEINTDQLSLLKENIEILNQFLHGEAKASPSFACLEELLHYYCNCLVKVIVKFRNYKPIQSQINPTITLDGSCYKLYSVYDEQCKINRWFLDIMSMEVGKRIKGLELTGFHHAKKIMKHKKYANLVLSFDPIDMSYYAHFTFPSRQARKARTSHKNPTSLTARKAAKQQKKPTLCQQSETKSIQYKLYSSRNLAYSTSPLQLHLLRSQSTTTSLTAKLADTLMTMLTVGGDFGLTENYTFSDGWVSGRKQGKILNHIANSTKNSVTSLQRISEKGYFGVEKNNQTGKRNHKNNCFTHNKLLDNINENYRKKQCKYNRFLQNYKYLLVNEIIDHFTSDSVYGQYSSANATHESHAPVKLVFESLEYTSLGQNKSQKRQINLISVAGILNVLEEKIERYNLPIEIEYVNPAYTSQACPCCCFVAKKNRDSKAGRFRCQHCGFTAIDDERYKGLTKVVPRSDLPSEDDFIASRNIAERPSTIPDSMKLRVREIKKLLMQKHESAKLKVSCKTFEVPNGSVNSSEH